MKTIACKIGIMIPHNPTHLIATAAAAEVPGVCGSPLERVWLATRFGTADTRCCSNEVFPEWGIGRRLSLLPTRTKSTLSHAPWRVVVNEAHPLGESVGPVELLSYAAK